MKILVTGAAGFIGHALVCKLAERGYEVLGMDNLNDYYDIQLKLDRLEDIGIDFIKDDLKPIDAKVYTSTKCDKVRFIKLDLTDKNAIDTLFENEKFDYVCNLAAQAGVRYSLINPDSYIQSNIVGLMNILEACRHNPVKHLIYASSSSVYGGNTKVPYSETDQVDKPVSLYAATKKSSELMSHAYSKLYNIPTTGLRFFTVYGPWGRPDMAPFLFLNAILKDEQINVFNHGDMQRDFTYIDDIIDGIMEVIPSPSTKEIPYEIYNIGHSTPIKLQDFISTISKVSGKKVKENLMGMQPGDVKITYADMTKFEKSFNYKPKVSLDEGIKKFYDWFMKYYN
ncbi:MAG: NAD-dependent epimerase/dehydratase family protein [Bacteroidales bacterium]